MGQPCQPSVAQSHVSIDLVRRAMNIYVTVDGLFAVLTVLKGQVIHNHSVLKLILCVERDPNN